MTNNEYIGTHPWYNLYLERLYRFKHNKECLEFDLNLIKTEKSFDLIPADEKEDLINKYEFAISKLDNGDSVPVDVSFANENKNESLNESIPKTRRWDDEDE